MSDELAEDEINLKLARHFEPEPTFKEGNSEWNGRDCLSDKGYWWCEQHHRFDGRDRHPINVIENAGLVLMMMQRGRLTVEPGIGEWIAGQRYFNGTVGMLAKSATGISIGQAVGLAYIKKEGL